MGKHAALSYLMYIRGARGRQRETPGAASAKAALDQAILSGVWIVDVCGLLPQQSVGRQTASTKLAPPWCNGMADSFVDEAFPPFDASVRGVNADSSSPTPAPTQWCRFAELWADEVLPPQQAASVTSTVQQGAPHVPQSQWSQSGGVQPATSGTTVSATIAVQSECMVERALEEEERAGAPGGPTRLFYGLLAPA